MSAETWMPIPTWDGYEASDRGRVRSWRYLRGTDEPRILSAHIPNTGYWAVSMYQGERRKRKHVHVLVAAAFYGQRPEGLMVRHLDGNPLNNALSNLRYGTSTENHLDAVAHGTHFQSRKTACKHGHAYTPDNTTFETKSNGRQQRRCVTCVRLRSARRRAA